MTIAEMFLLGWACLTTALWQYKVWQYKFFMRATASVIEDVLDGRAKFVMKANDEGGKTFTIEKVQ
jgi:hypothetical protein